MTSSAGTSGLIFAASPPRSAIASRMAARSTTAGTPVKSCMTTRAGVKAISSLGSALASQRASFSTSAACDRAVALGAQQVLEQHLEAEGQPRHVVLRLQRVEAEDRVLAVADLQRVAGVERVRVLGHGQVLSGVVGEQHEGFPGGRGHRAEVLVDGRDAAACAADRRARRARRRSRPSEGMPAGDRERLGQRVRPPANARRRRRRGRATAPRAPRPPPRRATR